MLTLSLNLTLVLKLTLTLTPTLTQVNYSEETVCECFRSRVGWLGLFLIGLWSAAFIIDAFEKTLQANTHPAESNIHMTCTCTRTPAPPPSAHTHTQHAYRAEVTYPRRESLLSVPIPSGQRRTGALRAPHHRAGRQRRLAGGLLGHPSARGQGDRRALQAGRLGGCQGVGGGRAMRLGARRDLDH